MTFSACCRMAIGSAPRPASSLGLSVAVGPWMEKCEQPTRVSERAEDRARLINTENVLRWTLC